MAAGGASDPARKGLAEDLAQLQEVLPAADYSSGEVQQMLAAYRPAQARQQLQEEQQAVEEDNEQQRWGDDAYDDPGYEVGSHPPLAQFIDLHHAMPHGVRAALCMHCMGCALRSLTAAPAAW